MTGVRSGAVDWEAVEREYRAGQLSVSEISRRYGIDRATVQRRARTRGWRRALANAVQAAVRDRLARADTDQEIIAAAAERSVGLVISHRGDLARLRGLTRMLMERLTAVLHGQESDGPCLGERETPGMLLEKLARVTAVLIQLERQAYSLDEQQAPAVQCAIVIDRPPEETREAWLDRKRRELGEPG